MTILSHTEKELIICLYTIKINNVVTFEIFEMHSRIFILCRAPRWNPVRTMNLRLNFTWFKKFQISARLGNCNGLAMTKT